MFPAEQEGPMSTDWKSTSHMSAAGSPEHVAAPVPTEQLVEILKQGPRGAFLLAGVSVGLLFVGWLLFYFVLFIPRGSIG
jgi:hypothetical protein